MSNVIDKSGQLRTNQDNPGQFSAAHRLLIQCLMESAVKGTKMANHKTSTGFDLVIGNLLNEGWERRIEPYISLERTCDKCHSQQLEVWRLERRVQAFGQIIIQTCQAVVCTNCLHEVLTEAHQPKGKKGKVKKPSLSKAKIAQLSKFLEGLTDDKLKELLK